MSATSANTPNAVQRSWAELVVLSLMAAGFVLMCSRAQFGAARDVAWVQCAGSIRANSARRRSRHSRARRFALRMRLSAWHLDAASQRAAAAAYAGRRRPGAERQKQPMPAASNRRRH